MNKTIELLKGNYMDINIRQATENDRSDIALCIAEGLKKILMFYAKIHIP